MDIRRRTILTREEDAVEAHLFARIACFKIEANSQGIASTIFANWGTNEAQLSKANSTAKSMRRSIECQSHLRAIAERCPVRFDFAIEASVG
jgi:hypothetical protein